MGWEMFAMLALKEGVPFAVWLAKKWGTKTPPTDADYEEALAITKQTAADRFKAKLVEYAIPLDSEKAKELMAQAGA